MKSNFGEVGFHLFKLLILKEKDRFEAAIYKSGLNHRTTSMISPGGIPVLFAGRIGHPWKASFSALFPCKRNEVRSRSVSEHVFPSNGVSGIVFGPAFSLSYGAPTCHGPLHYFESAEE